MSQIKSVLIKPIMSLLLVMVLFSYSAESQVKKYTLDEAIKTALENNSDTRIALLEVQKAQAAIEEAFGYALPSVGLSANLSHLIEKPRMPFPDFGAMLNNSTYAVLEAENLVPKDPDHFKPMASVLQAFALSNNYEAKLEVTQILFNSAVFTGIGASAKYLQTSQEMLNSKVSKTVLQVKKAFYGIVLAKEAVELTKSSLENFQKHLSNVRALYNSGLAAEYNLLQAEVQFENFKPAMLETENNLKNALEGLKLLLRIDNAAEIDVEGALVYKEVDLAKAKDLIAEASRNNLDVKTLEMKVEVDEAFIDLDRSDWWPSLAAFGSYSFNGSSDDFNFLNYRQSVVGLSLSVNLFNGNRTKNKVQQSTIERLKTVEQLSQLRSFLAMQIKTKLNELDRLKQNLISTDRNVQLAEKTAQIASVGYTNGTRTQLEVLTAENQLRQAKTNRLQSVYLYVVTISEIDDLIGNISQDYINMVMRNEKNK